MLVLPSVEEIRPFAYCKNGFVHKKLRILLQIVPLYDINSEANAKFIPSETVELALCDISPDNFLNWKNGLIEILYEDQVKNSCYIKAINFNDIHKVCINLFIIDPFSLSSIISKTINEIDEINKNVNKIVNETKNFKNNHIFQY